MFIEFHEVFISGSTKDLRDQENFESRNVPASDDWDTSITFTARFIGE